MPNAPRRPPPFRFFTQLHLYELTGRRASTLPQLLRLLRTLPDAALYCHTHQFLQRHHSMTPAPPSDFAQWVRQALGDERLAEALAGVDTVQFARLDALRDRLIDVLADHLRNHPSARLRFADAGEEFHAVQVVSFVLPTPYVAGTLAAFREHLARVTVQSIYFHMFAARLRLRRATNDFSAWLAEMPGETTLARQFEQGDPYALTLEELRAQLLAHLDRRLGPQQSAVRP